MVVGLFRVVVGASLALAVVGCSSDDSALAAEGGTGFGADEDSGQADGEDALGDRGDDESDGANVPDGETGEGGTGAGADDGADEGPDENFFCDARCDNAGECIVDEQTGVPSCECEDGYAAFGLRCLRCDKSEGLGDIELRAADVRFSVTLNGAPLDDVPYEYGDLWLRDRASGDEVYIGATRDDALEVAVLHGTYDLLYERRLGGSILPRNAAGVLIDQLVVEANMDVDVDIAAVRMFGTVSMNGVAPPNSGYQNGALVLVNTATGDELKIGETHNGEYEATVLPGTYALHYQRILGGEEVPRNDDAYLEDVEVEIREGNTYRFDINVPVVELSGEFLLNGDTAPTSGYESGEILLSDTRTGATVNLGRTRDGSYTRLVTPGTYEVIYDRTVAGEQMPVNEEAILEVVEIMATDSLALNVDVRTAVVSGTVALDTGGAPGPTEDAMVALLDPTTGDEIDLGRLSEGAFSRRVVAGDYAVIYKQLSAADTLPANTSAQLSTVSLAAGEQLDATIEIPTASVAGSILMDGLPPPTSEFADGRLYLRDPETGDSVLLGSTRLGDFAATVIPGTYDVVYVVETAGQDVPVNSEANLMLGVEVGAGGDLHIDVPVFEMAGGVLLNDVAVPANPDDRAQLLAIDTATGDAIYLGATDSGGFARNVTAGRYVVVYENLATTGLMPANVHAGVGCFELAAP